MWGIGYWCVVKPFGKKVLIPISTISKKRSSHRIDRWDTDTIEEFLTEKLMS